MEVSIVIPCLNEADTLESCIQKARQALESNRLEGEIIVADNDSTDASPTIARTLGAIVVQIRERGYGNALKGGIAAARGTYIIMADADDSYDFLDIPRFVEKLRAGYELVQGCRLSAGGGTVLPGAMPFLHRVGNPIFSWIARRWLGVSVHDIHCGMRGFTRSLYADLDLQCQGMEFASEMILKATRHRAKITEIPITLYPDGRRSHVSHLRTFRDGLRHLRFFLLYSLR
jgi:glycosyltransferase involved in cell wall biosynthesis